MSKRHERILARRAAVQILYQSEISGEDALELIDAGLVPEEAKANDYARQLVSGVAEHRAELDRAISDSSQNWAISRMPVVDRSILRMAIYEMNYVDEVPQSVTINEAVELAKEFGGEDDSHRFVNGVLGKLARQGENGGQADAPSAVSEMPEPAVQGILSDFVPAVEEADAAEAAEVESAAACSSDEAAEE